MSIPATFRSSNRGILRAPQAAPGRPLIPPVPPPKRHPYDQWSPDARALDLVGDKWTLLIIRDLAAGPRRFVELQRVLPGISTEQLRSRLNRMVADGLLTRQRYREVPPRVDYELTERSRELIPVLGALARWGYDWTWSAPRPGEDVNVGAIFRLAPGMLEPPAGPRRHRRADRGGRGRRARAPVPGHARGRSRRDLRGRRRAADGVGARHGRGLGARTRSRGFDRDAADLRPRRPGRRGARRLHAAAALARPVARDPRLPLSPCSDRHPSSASRRASASRPRRARPCRAMSDRGPR